MHKVNMDVVKPWITKRVTEILGFEDDVVIEFIFNLFDGNQVTVTLYWRPLVLTTFYSSLASSLTLKSCR